MATPNSPAAKAADGPTSPPAGDGAVTNRPDGEGTRQREPKPEDYPASAKITPPAQQLNSANAQVIGTPALPEQVGANADDLKAASDRTQAAADKAIERTDKAFEQKAKDEDEAAKADADA
jgi:hypothetical protein